MGLFGYVLSKVLQLLGLPKVSYQKAGVAVV